MTTIHDFTLGSLFDGIGGFPYAASFYGIRALWASEILPVAVSVTKRHFPHMAHVGDITRLHGGTLPPVDIITFGSPCQGLSMAGKRLGLADERSGLFSEAIRIIKEMREVTHGRYPQIAVWENVPGALSTDGGRDFKAVLEAFTEAKIPMPPSGRWANAGMVRGRGVDLAWCVYDAQYFGTAQRRRRVFLIADFTGRRAGEILFVPQSLRGYFAAGGTPRQGASAYFEGGAGAADAGIDGYNGEITGQVAATLGVNCGMSTGRNGVLNIEADIEVLNDQGGDSFSVEQHGVSPTLRSETHGNLPIVAGRVVAFMGGQSASSGSIGYSEHVAPTLRAGNSGSNRTPCICEPQLARTLTARGDSSPCADRGQNIVAVGINGDHAGPIAASYYKGTGARSGTERDVVLCAATGQAGAEVLPNQCPTLNCNHEQPYITHPQVSGTLCGSGAGLSRPAGMASEADFCIVQEAIPIHDRATRCTGGGSTRRNDGAGNGLGVGRSGDPAPTITAGDRHSVAAAVDCRNLRETSEISGTLQSKVQGYSLNYQNPVRAGYSVRRLTPVECERLQGYPDGWTAYGGDGAPISDTRRYQMLGNSVAVPCVAYLMQGIRRALEGR